MNCSKCRNLMDDYIGNSLTGAELDDFINHVSQCEDCMEELRINYSLLTALDQLDRGDELSEDYDFELEQKIKKYKDRKKKRKIFFVVSYAVIFLLAVVFSVIIQIFLTENEGKNEKIVFASEKDAGSLLLGHDGVPDYLNPVRKAVYEHNDEVIEFLHLIAIESENNNEQ